MKTYSLSELSKEEVIRLAESHGLGWTFRDEMDYLNLLDFAKALIDKSVKELK